MNVPELRADGVSAYDVLCALIEQGEAQYHADCAAIRDGLARQQIERHADAASRAEALQRARAVRDKAWRDETDRPGTPARPPGPVDPGPGWVPVYEPFTYTLPPVTTTYHHHPAPAPAPVRRSLRSRAATVRLVVRLIVVGAVVYVVALGALVEVLS